MLNPPDPLQLSSGNVCQNWKRFKQKWSNYELAIGIDRKEDPIRVATFLTVIGDEALDVYNGTVTKTKLKWIKLWSVSSSIVSLARILFTRGIYSFRVDRKVDSPLINMPQFYETWRTLVNFKI